jgi:hypothetical protein
MGKDDSCVKDINCFGAKHNKCFGHPGYTMSLLTNCLTSNDWYVDIWRRYEERDIPP